MSTNNAGGDDLLGKADALMRRHRVFVAHTEPQADQPVTAPLPELPAEPVAVVPAFEPQVDDDVPVLTEIVPVDELIEALGAQPMLIRRADAADEIQRWLDETLPETVLQVMDGLSDKLVAALTERARAELIDRLIRLPDGEAPDDT